MVSVDNVGKVQCLPLTEGIAVMLYLSPWNSLELCTKVHPAHSSDTANISIQNQTVLRLVKSFLRTMNVKRD